MRFAFEVSRTVVTAGPAAGNITLVAEHRCERIGIAVGWTAAGRCARLVRLRVKEPYRRRRVATTLLRMLEGEFQERECCRAEATLVCKILPPASSEFMLAAGWSGFQPQGVLGATDHHALTIASWSRYRKLPSHARLFPWATLKAAERHALCLAREQAPWFPPDLDPLYEEERIDKQTSFGLRHAGELAGWCIFHHLSNNATRCTSLFLREDLRHRGYALSLAANSILAHGRAQRGRIVFDVSLQREEMMHFFYRGLLPHLQAFSLIHRSVKQLKAEC